VHDDGEGFGAFRHFRPGEMGVFIAGQFRLVADVGLQKDIFRSQAGTLTETIAVELHGFSLPKRFKRSLLKHDFHKKQA
jgi:hypothetical protein